ncbi:hypothetical protein SBOR_7455 [Sclerotinia borealis F-4128]|uniref:DUF7918 domain-containing protein n=1 Tax=Sclerotinia borealis (strain F-4128) TaxID=1432307 RepID=W9CC66_SCLBF|nr:hypothetical protein SBOR_7455 [Sclerotinia borealis F-4128]
MAILDSLPGIEVTICVDGEPLLEYENNEDDIEIGIDEGVDEDVTKHQRSVTVKNYIESTAGSFFGIQCSVEDSYRYTGDCTEIGFHQIVDGIRLPSYDFVDIDDFFKSGFASTLFIEGAYLDSTEGDTLRTFKFVEIRSTHDNDKTVPTNATTKALSIGEIEVWVYREMFLMEDERREVGELTALNSEVTVIEEALKGKAVSHGTSYGKSEPIDITDWERFEFCGDGEDYPIAIFKFRYGSKKDLQALGVIERTPEPELELKFEPESMLEPKLKSEPEASQDPISAIATVPTASPNVALPMNPPNMNFHSLDPTQTGQLFGQFLQYLQTQGGIQSAQTPASSLQGTIATVIPAPPKFTRASINASVATPDPPVKREREENETGGRKKRRKQIGKHIIDLTENDSDDEIVIDLDSD